jgi:hypothetical protein
MKGGRELENYYRGNNYIVFAANKTNFNKFSNLAKQIKQLENAKKNGKKGIMFYNSTGTNSYLLETKSIGKMKRSLLRGGEPIPITEYTDEDFVRLAQNAMAEFRGKKMCIGGSFALKLWDIYVTHVLECNESRFGLTPIQPSDIDVYGKYYEIREGAHSNEYIDFAKEHRIYNSPNEATRAKPYENVFTFTNNQGKEISGNVHLNAKGLTYNILNFGNDVKINVASLDTLQKGLNIRIDDGTKLEKAKQAQEYLRYFKCCLCTSMLEINQNNLSTGRTPSKRPRNSNYGSTARSLF